MDSPSACQSEEVSKRTNVDINDKSCKHGKHRYSRKQTHATARASRTCKSAVAAAGEHKPHRAAIATHSVIICSRSESLKISSGNGKRHKTIHKNASEQSHVCGAAKTTAATVNTMAGSTLFACASRASRCSAQRLCSDAILSSKSPALDILTWERNEK